MLSQRVIKEEERLRSFIEAEPSFSETAASLATKTRVSVRTARRVLDRYSEIGMVTRRSFHDGIEPVYYRFQARAGGSFAPWWLR